MARGKLPDSAESQFFVLLRPDADLNGEFTVFARVLEGLDVVATLEKGDALEKATVVRKRDHDYVSEKIR